jgi:hypothetical protein
MKFHSQNLYPMKFPHLYLAQFFFLGNVLKVVEKQVYNML